MTICGTIWDNCCKPHQRNRFANLPAGGCSLQPVLQYHEVRANKGRVSLRRENSTGLRGWRTLPWGWAVPSSWRTFVPVGSSSKCVLRRRVKVRYQLEMFFRVQLTHAVEVYNRHWGSRQLIVEHCDWRIREHTSHVFYGRYIRALPWESIVQVVPKTPTIWEAYTVWTNYG